MKRKKFLIYIVSGIIPVIIFLICALINNLLPFGKYILNIYDSYTQYPGFLLEYKKALKTGNIFYSWNAGGGFNLYGALTYYTFSPLNLLCLLSTSTNYPYFIAIMTIIRFFLLGVTTSFYLEKKGISIPQIILFSTTFTLSGFTASYYYNFLWFDSIIMLPLVAYGIDKLFKERSKFFYILTLTLAIIFNYYIGFMICIFSLLYFIYNIFLVEKKKIYIITFIKSSLLSGFMCAFILIPSFCALRMGKSVHYSYTNYLGFVRNFQYFFYMLTSGSYQQGDQAYGPAQVYTGIITIVLTIFFFFNKNISNKEKKVALFILLFYLLSFVLNIFNFAWQFFQEPIWWQSRFSFTFSFFLIILASRSIKNINRLELITKKRILFLIITLILMSISFYLKYKNTTNISICTCIFFAFSIILLIGYFFYIDKRGFFPLILIFAVFDVSINTFNNLKQNNHRGILLTHNHFLRSNVSEVVNDIKKKDNDFFRLELEKPYTSNDGLYFNYHGINYFNSTRNNNATTILRKLGIKVIDDCDVKMNKLNPLLLSIYNIKYIYGNIPYYKDYNNYLKENPYPLSLGYIVSDKVKDLKLDKDLGLDNIELFLNSLNGSTTNIYIKIDHNSFLAKDINFDNKYYTPKKDKATLTYTFKSKEDFILLPSNRPINIVVNQENVPFLEVYPLIKKGDEVQITYNIYGKTSKNLIYVYLLKIDTYKSIMEKLSSTTLQNIKTFKNNHIIEGDITLQNEGFLFTTINYEKGMKVFIDKKEVNPTLILNNYIGLDIKSGKHHIYVDYIPEGLKSGIIISISSLILTIIYLRKRQF